MSERAQKATGSVKRQPQSIVPAAISDPGRAETVAAQPFDIVARELGQEDGIALCRDDQKPIKPGTQPYRVARRADDGPGRADFIAGEPALEALPDMPGCAPGPDDVGEVVRHQQQCGGAHALVASGDDRSNRGADADADDSDPLIAFSFEPGQAGARIKHGLPVGPDGQTQVFAGELAGKSDPDGLALVMIGQAELDAGYAAAVDQRAERLAGLPRRAPVGEQHDGAAAVPGLEDLRACDAVAAVARRRAVARRWAVESEHRTLAAEDRRCAAGEVGVGIAQRGVHASEQLRQFVRGAPGLETVQADGCLTGEFGRYAFGGEPALALADK